jgi:membrane protease YdiL (CAAX protease family)
MIYTVTLLEFFKLKPIGFLSAELQVIIILFLFTVAILTQNKEYKRTGKTYGRYPWRISTFLSSIYEEIIFRGFILVALLSIVSPIIAVAISSCLFGIWHIKNYKWQTKQETIYQVLYAALIFGPIASIITLETGTIWVAVILHYINNLLADAWRKQRL